MYTNTCWERLGRGGDIDFHGIIRLLSMKPTTSKNALSNDMFSSLKYNRDCFTKALLHLVVTLWTLQCNAIQTDPPTAWISDSDEQPRIV